MPTRIICENTIWTTVKPLENMSCIMTNLVESDQCCNGGTHIS